MEMCYDGALVMPNNFIIVDDEEMTYVEGGVSYTTYKGTSAWNKVSTMFSSIVTHYTSAWALAKFAGATSATGVGLILAIASAVGCQLALASGGVQVAMTALAIVYTKKYGGFKCANFSTYQWSWDMVKRI